MEYKNYSDFVKKEGLVAPDRGLFLEGIGVLLHKELVDISLVDDLFSGPIKMAWEKFKHVAEDARKQLNQPQYAEWVEYLYNKMQKREQRPKQIQKWLSERQKLACPLCQNTDFEKQEGKMDSKWGITAIRSP